jgi:uncharacterized repeat protein (TIGR01451 family)
MFSVFGRHSKPLLALLFVLATGRCLFAGKEFLPGPQDQVVSGQLLVGLQLGADINQILAAVAPQASATLISHQRNAYLLNLPPGLQAIASQLLAAHPLVNYVEPNHIRSSTVAPPNDPYLTTQWALTNIQAAQAWSYFPDHYLTSATAGVNRVKVAVLDTGADCTHPDFMNAGGSSTDSASGGQLDWNDSIAITATTISSPACPWEDDNGHGTHTAGIVAAATDNATGVASLGFALQLVIIKVSNGSGDSTDYLVAEGIYDAIAKGAQVISMSLGGAGYSETMQQAMDYAWANNVLVVAAAGNQSGTALIYPGDGNHVLGVSATDDNNALAGFSDYGEWVKIAGPGVNVMSTLPSYGSGDGTGYGELSGTSMATPHVAALGGLLFAANPGVSVAAVAQRIQQTAQSSGTGWNEYLGYGVINAGAALAGIPGGFTQGSFTGQVIDPNGNPITGAVVSAGSASYTTALDPATGALNGLFRIANLSPGTYTITVSYTGYPTLTMQGVIVAGADTMLTIQMGVSYGEFSGTVTYNGAAVAGAAVEAVSGGLVQGTAVTDASGSYTLSVFPGTYTLTASAPNYINSMSVSQPLSANGTVTVNLPLSALGNITGKVTDGNGVGVPNAHIDFTSGSFSGGAVTGVGGTYSTFGVPAGTYTVTASASGYSSVSVTGASVATNTSTLVDLQFSTGVALGTGLLGSWPLNDDTGSVAHDISGNGYNAALSNTTWVPGLFDYAVSFNGSSSQAATPAIPFTNTFSASVWVNPASSPQVPRAGFVQSESSSGLSLGVDSTGTMYKFIVNGGSGTTGSCAFQNVTYGCAQGGTVTSGWHMVTGTYDGTTAILYVDGAMVASDTFTAPANVTVPVEIGTGALPWNGALDALQLYSRALTASEVSALFDEATTLSLTKTADSSTVAAGGSIGYKLAVTNSGAGTAASPALTDVLPAGTGIGWSISPAYGGPGTCTIANGTLSCSFGTMAPGGTASVYVMSATTALSCGVYTNTASANANNASLVQASATIAVQCGQTITFGTLSNEEMGTAPFQVSASSTSGLTVTFASLTTSQCTVSGTTVTLVSVGTCTIEATQAGDAAYTPATPVDESFTVTQGSQTINFGTLSNQTFGAAPFTVSASATSGLTVGFASLSTSQCTVSGTTVTLAAGGTCTIQATQAGNANFTPAPFVNQSFTVNPASQTINFGTLSNQTFGAAAFTVNASATSNLPVSFNSQTTPVCTVAGSLVTLVAGGMCTIQAMQAGNASYTAAPNVSQSFTVNPASQTINFGALPNQTLGAAPFTVSATATSNLPVSFNSQTASICTVSGSTVALIAGGTCTIQAMQAGSTSYTAAPNVNQSFTVYLQSQTITFGGLANQTYGSAAFTVSASASSNLPVSFNSQTTSVCTVSGSTVTLVAGGTCTIQATQAGNATYSPAPNVNQSFTVNPESQTITFGTLSNQTFGVAAFTVNASATSNLPVSFNSQTTSVCTVSGSTVTLIAGGTCTIQAMQGGNATYSPALNVNQSFTVNPESQTITFGTLSSQTFGAAPFTVSATATSNLPVGFNSQTTSVCTVSNATVTLLSGGTCTIQATQAGNASYTAAAPVNQSFTVNPESQTITFGTLSNQTFGAAAFTVTASATSNLPVSFNSQTTSICTVSNATVTLLSGGTCTIQATQGGSASYTAAPTVSRSFTVNPASQTITFATLSSQAFGASPFTVSASATSNLPVNFTSQTPSVCTVSNATVTLLSGGTCTIQANQPGNTSYTAAPAVNQSFIVASSSQTITFGTLPNEALGTAAFTVSASATSTLPVSFNSQTTSICSVATATVTLVAIGTCTIQATQAGNATYAAATSVNQSFLVTGGLAVPGGSVSFANTIVGKPSATLTTTLQNGGNTALTIAAIAPTGPDAANYQYTADAARPCPISPATLAAGATCTLDVTFVPLSQGGHNNAQLAIVDNSGNVAGSTQTISLTGMGIVLSSLAINAASASLAYNSTEQFTATGTYSDSSTANLTTQATWTSGTPGVATIATGGLATAVASGQTNITAVLGSVTSNNFQLTVLPGTASGISVWSGSPQSATMGTAFGSPLQALVKDGGGNAVPNAQVTFTAPSIGAGGTFANGQATYTAATNSSGVASSLTLTANANAGSYSVTASAAGVTATASFSLTNLKAPALTISEAPANTFVQGQTAVFTVTVGNATGSGPTSGLVTVTETVPNGVTLLGMSGGPAWNCTVPPSCTINTALSGGSTYPAIAITLGVPYNAPALVTNQVSASGGGSAAAAASDQAPVVATCDVTQSSSPSVADVQQIVNEALGLAPPANDLNGDTIVNVLDVQIVVNAVMGMGCSAS